MNASLRKYLGEDFFRGTENHFYTNYNDVECSLTNFLNKGETIMKVVFREFGLDFSQI